MDKVLPIINLLTTVGLIFFIYTQGRIDDNNLMLMEIQEKRITNLQSQIEIIKKPLLERIEEAEGKLEESHTKNQDPVKQN